MIFIIACQLVAFCIDGQTNPTAQTLPYFQDFSSFTGSTTTYPAGWQGWTIAGSLGTSYPTAAPSGNQALAGTTNATTSAFVGDMNRKIGILSTASNLVSVVLAINTTSLSSIQLTYTASTQAVNYQGRVDELGLQYRIGTSGTFTNISTDYWNSVTNNSTTAVVTPSNSAIITATLPSACNGQSVVQLRWVMKDSIGAGNRPSFSITNVTVAAASQIVNYYNTASTNLDNAANWGTATNGTGSHPSNFTTAGQVFNIHNANTGVTASTWTVSGAASKIVVEGTDFTIASGKTITALVDVNASRTLTIQSTTFPTLNVLAPTSTVSFKSLTSITIPLVIAGYGNIIFDATTVANPATMGDIMFAGNFKLQTAGAAFSAANLNLCTKGTSDQYIFGGGFTLSCGSLNNNVTNTKTGKLLLGPTTNMTINNSINMINFGAANNFTDSGNTLTVLGNVTDSGDAAGYNLTGTIGFTATAGTSNISGGANGTVATPAVLKNVTVNTSGTAGLSFNPAAGSGTTTIKGNFTLTASGSGLVVFNANTIKIGGNFTHTPTTNKITFAGSTVEFNGTSAQTYSSLITTTGCIFNNLTMNGAGGLTLSNNMQATGTLTLTTGKLTTGAQTFTLASSGSLSGGSATSYINGSFAKGIAAATTTKTFEVGDAAAYAPVTLTFNGGSVAAGTITVKATAGNHPTAGSFINSAYFANRYWTITNSGTSGFTSLSTLLNYNLTDISATTGGATSNSSFIVRQLNGTWSTPTCSNPTSTSSQASAIAFSAAFGDYIAGQIIPTITSVSPNSANPGATVTISGPYFNTNAGQHKVFFGATRAAVSSSSGTSLTVTAPTGATYGPISVLDTVTRGTGYEQYAYMPKFDNSSYIPGLINFATGVAYSGTSAFGIAIGDLDGDGKPDVVVANRSTNTVSVYRNTSSSGSITSGSFASPVDFALSSPGGSCFRVALGDMDGDGKLDIVAVANSSGSFAVFRNTSTSGSITSGSFASSVPFLTATGSSPVDLALGDLNGDGKLDVAVINEASSTVSIYRNTGGSPGSINFAVRVDYATGPYPEGIAIGDLDGDSKPEMVITSEGSNSVIVYKNNSTGTFTAGSFAASYFTTGNSPFDVAIGDLDGDGKPDLSVTNYGDNTVSVLRNTGSSGSINFATNVDFATGSNPQAVAVGDIDGDGKADIAVTNSGGNSLSVIRNISSSGAITTGSFATKVDFTSYSSFLVIGDLDGDGKPELATTSSGINVMHNAPLFPITGTRAICSGTTTTLTDARSGGAWSSGSSGIATVNSSGVVTGVAGGATVISYTAGDVSDTFNITIKATPAITLTPASVFQCTGGNTNITASGGSVSYSWSPGAGLSSTTGATVNCNATSSTIYTVTGTGSSGCTRVLTETATVVTSVTLTVTPSSAGIPVGFPQTVSVSGGGNYIWSPATTLSATTGGAVVATPTTATTYTVTETSPACGGVTATSTLNIQLPPTISSVSPNIANPGTSVTITGSNFNTTAANNIVYFGATKAVVSSASATSLSVISPAGGSYAPISLLDSVTGEVGYEQYAFLPKFNDSAYIPGLVSFNGKVDLSTGSTPEGVAVSDLDGDGKADLIVANSGANTITVYRNVSSSGAIVAGSFSGSVSFATGTTPAYVKAADVDGDGKPDIIVANSGSATISVFRNTTGPGAFTSGSFAAKVDFSVGTSPFDVAIADFDGDGKADIAVPNSGSTTISILRNTSSSGSPSFATAVNCTTGATPKKIFAGDLDGDGKPDLAVTNNGTATVSVFLNTASAGSLTTSSFAAKVDFTTGTAPWGLTAADIDGDGKPELIVANQSSGTLSVFRNTSTSGAITSGSFAAKVDFTTGTSPRDLSVGDFDGDSKVDIGVVNATSATVSVFRNTGTSGSIASGSLAAKADFGTGTSPLGIAIGDLDLDGKPDIIIANSGGGTVSILRNRPILLVPSITSVSPNIANPGTSITITGTNFNTTAANNKVYFGAEKAVVSSASATSLTVTSPVGGTFARVSVLDSADGQVGYEQFPYLPKYDNSAYLSGTVKFDSGIDLTSETHPRGVAIGDLDGDGKPDMVVANYFGSSVSVYRNISSSGSISAGSFASRVNFATTGSPAKVVIGDLDGDGKLDIVAVGRGSGSLSILRNTCSVGSITTGSFASAVNFTVGAAPEMAAIGDVDGDGKPDLITANNGDNTVSVLQNIGAPGSITSASFANRVNFAAGTVPSYVAIGDLDGDGRPDVAATNAAGGSVSVFRNTSTVGLINTGSFATKVDFTTGGVPQSVALADIDGDGKADMVVSGNSAGILVFRNVSSAGSITTGSFGGVAFSTGARPWEVAVGDIDGDGKPDLVTANTDNNTISVLRNTSSSGSLTSGSFAARIDYATDSTPMSIAIGDLDGDGLPDIAVPNYDSTTVTIFRNHPLLKPPVITSVSPNVANPGTSVTITGSGFDTSVVNNKVFFGATRAVVTTASAGSLTVISPVSGTLAPISVLDSVTGLSGYEQYAYLPKYDNSIYLSGTLNFVTKVDFTSLTTPQAVVFGDLDGDGKADMVIANSGSAKISVYRNNSSSGSITGGSFAAKVDFTTGTAPANVRIADIDGDGKLDILVTNSGSASVSVFRNTAASGTITTGSFASKVDFTVGTTPFDLGVADFDGDGKPDIAVANSGSTNMSVLKNNGSAGFISFAAAANFTTGTTPKKIYAGDLDGDGKPDIAVTNNGTTTVSVFRNTATTNIVNSSSFAAKVDFTTGTAPWGLTAADIDGDGKPELLVANQTSGTLSVFLNTATSGAITSGSFASKVDFTTGSSPRDFAVGDFDGDGKVDIGVANASSNTVSVFRNTATSGTIGSGSLAAKSDFATGTTPLGIAIGDLDGDGIPDIAVSNSGTTTVSVIRNNPLQLLPTITSLSPNSANKGATVTITGTNFNTTAANNKVYFGATKASVSSASATSLSVVVPSGATFAPVSVLNATSNLTAYEDSFFTPVFTNSYFKNDTLNFKNNVTLATTSANSTPYTGAIGDLDGDGKSDLVVNNYDSSTVSVFLNTSASGSISSGSFTLYNKITLAGKPQNVKLADIDGDGKLDVVAALSNNNNVEVLRNTTSSTGNPTFAGRVDLAAGNVSAVSAITDFDGDGKADIAVSLPAGLIGILRNTSTAGSVSFAAVVNVTVGSVPSGLCFADLDRDGLPDIATVNSGFTGSAYSGSTASVSRNTSTPGNISFATAATLTTGSGPIDIAAADIDGDHKADLLVTNFNDGTFSVFRNIASPGSLTSGSFSTRVNFTAGSGPTGIAAGDLSGDGKLDVVVSNAFSNTVSMFRNTASSGSITSGSFAAKLDFATSANPAAVTIGDLDGDGYPDVVTGNSGSNSISILRNYPLPDIGPISGGASICAGGGTTSLTNTVGGGTWSMTNGNATINSSGLVSGVSVGNDTAIYTIVAGGDTSNARFPITINAMQWLGATSADWNNAANWSCGYVPGTTNDVIIPIGTTYSPVIGVSVNDTIRDMVIASGAVVTLSSGATLAIRGNLTNNGSIAGVGTLNMNNTIAQTVGGIGSVSNFNVSNSSGVTVNTGSRLTVKSVLSLTSGFLATGDSVVLYSDSFGSARVAPLTTGTSITGNVKVNQYMSGGRRAYRFWAHPFNDYIPLTQLINYIDISGPGGVGNGFTTTSSNAPSAYWYNTYGGNSSLNYDPGWRQFASAYATTDSNKFKQYQGIRMYYRGAKEEGLWTLSYRPSPTVVSQWGVLNQGGQDIPLHRGSSALQDYTMVGNPYASPVDIGTVIFNAAAAGRINGAYFWVWNPFLGVAGQFQSLPYSTGGGSPAPIPYYLQSNDAFQVRTLHDGDLLNFTEANKSATVSNAYSLMKARQDFVSLYVYDVNYHPYDMFYARFDSAATEAEDIKFDGGKPAGADFNFYSLSSDKHRLSVDVRPFTVNGIIPLGVGSSYEQDYIIRVENLAVPEGGRVYLHDKLLKRLMLLQQGTEYRFSVTKEQNTQGEERFELILESTDLSSAATSTGLEINLIPNPATDQVSISFRQSKPAKVSVQLLDMSGVSVYNNSVDPKQNGFVNVSLANLAPGAYILELTVDGKKEQRQLIKE